MGNLCCGRKIDRPSDSLERDKCKIKCARKSAFQNLILILPHIAMIIALFSIFLGLSMEQKVLKVTYTFPEFPYKETNKNEVMFREVETVCERGCLGKVGVSKVLCIRQCVSPSCYRDLYQADQLEEGEVDVRLNSFKGCFIQRYNRSRP